MSKEFLAKGYTDRIRLVVYKDGKEGHQIITEGDILERAKAGAEIADALENIQEEVVTRVSKSSI